MAERRVRPDDEELLRRARRGDEAAFTELVRLHQDEVFTLALRLVADRHLAADVAQEAFIRAWRALPRFRGEAQFSTWLHRITVNVAWTQRKRQSRHRADPIDFAFVEPQSEGISPERAAESADIGDRLRRALGELSPAVRAVVVLKDVYGWSHGEIGDHLGISITAAKVRLHRGRKQLREMLWSDLKEDR